jgi:pyruvate ferredoxin oxidoreductase alpha subunit
MVNYIGGLGGRNISKDNIQEMFLELLRAADGEKGKRVRFVNVGSEYDG